MNVLDICQLAVMLPMACSISSGKVAIVTGANTGIGQAIALALAEAGADIAAGRPHRRPRRPPRRRRALGPARPSSIEADLVDDRAGRSASSTRRVAELGAARHPGQQCRHHPPRRRGRFHRGGLGRGDRHQSEDRCSSSARPPARHMIAQGARQDRQHRLAAELPGRHPRAELHRVQIGRRRAHQGCSPTNGRPRASTSTRSRRAISPPTTPPRCRPTRPATARSSSASRPGWGDASDLGGRGGVPGVGGGRLCPRPHPRRRWRLARALIPTSSSRIARR